MKRKIFGTDGIRGRANHYPMTPELSLKLGKAVAIYFKRKKAEPKVVIGKDTRVSGYMIETALTSGLVSMGATVFLVGPMPTPAVSFLTRSLNADAGIMISASHNPAEDNGIKIFDSYGFKLSDQNERKIEKIIFSNEMRHGRINGSNIGKAYRVEDAKARYAAFAAGSVENSSLSGLKVVLDCANGAGYSVGPQVLSGLGAEVIPINNSPDGTNINLGCGATSISSLASRVVREKADVGLALDGDADRVVVVDSSGKQVDGDSLLALLALDLKAKGKLAKDTVVCTVMSNSSLEKHLNSNGVKVVRTQVGDRYVIEEMRKNGYSFGGEQSGHVILGGYSTTGDGIIMSLQFLRIMKERGKGVAELCGAFEPNPQTLVNVKVREKRPLRKLRKLSNEIKAAGKILGKTGRVLIRYSGTEKIMRIMVEGEGRARIKQIADSIAEKAREEIGA